MTFTDFDEVIMRAISRPIRWTWNPHHWRWAWYRTEAGSIMHLVYDWSLCLGPLQVIRFRRGAGVGEGDKKTSPRKPAPRNA